jgi:hypothetical protein
MACASEWFSKAVAIDPARDKFIEAVIVEPTQKPWAALLNWANRNNCQLSAPKIDRPQLGNNPQTMVGSAIPSRARPGGRQSSPKSIRTKLSTAMPSRKRSPPSMPG